MVVVAAPFPLVVVVVLVTEPSREILVLEEDLTRTFAGFEALVAEALAEADLELARLEVPGRLASLTCTGRFKPSEPSERIIDWLIFRLTSLGSPSTSCKIMVPFLGTRNVLVPFECVATVFLISFRKVLVISLVEVPVAALSGLWLSALLTVTLTFGVTLVETLTSKWTGSTCTWKTSDLEMVSLGLPST